MVENLTASAKSTDAKEPHDHSAKETTFTGALAMLQEESQQLRSKKPTSAEEASKPLPKAQWTVAINIAQDWVTFRRMDELKQIVNDTKGKNVSILVQESVSDSATPRAPRPASPFDRYDAATGQPARKKDVSTPTEQPKPGTQSKSPSGFHLDRYLIRDGQIQKLETVPSTSYAADVESFVKFMEKKAPSDKIAYINDSHGGGNIGLMGNVGDASVKEFREAVQKGLVGSGHSRLDILDFDACQMGQNGVLRNMQGLADHIIASTENESIRGPELMKPIQQVLANPTLSADSLAENIIDAQRKNPPNDVRVETNSHYDMSKYKGFHDSLDVLGDKLTTVLKDPASRMTLDKLIDDTKRFGGWGDGPSDLQDFLNRVVDAIDNTKLPDSNGELKQAIRNLEKEEKKLVESYYGHGDYAKLGGISVFLPDAGDRANGDEKYKEELVGEEKGGWTNFRMALKEPAKGK
jgi:hypothetical protein